MDLEARFLVADLSPWASFVQCSAVQCCGRIGGNNTYVDAVVIVVNPVQALQKGEAELAATRKRLAGLDDASLRNLMELQALPYPDLGRCLRGYIFPQDLFEIHPAAQGDIDISPISGSVTCGCVGAVEARTESSHGPA